MWRWIGLGLIGILLALAGVIGWRTAHYGPKPVPTTPEAAAPAAALALDVQLAARHLSEAIGFATIANQDGSPQDVAAFTGLHAWMARTYPALHAAASPAAIAGQSLLFRWAGSDASLPPILLAAHQDVVPVEEGSAARWRAPAFSGAQRDGAVIGRGALDDKGSLIAILEAAEALAKTGFVPKRTILLAFGADEEVNGRGAQAMAALLAQRGEKPWFVLDEGMVIVQRHPVTSGPVALIGIAEKGYATLVITAKASAGHSSIPPKDLAVSRLAHALIRLENLPIDAGLDDGPAGAMLRALSPQLPLSTRALLANEWLFGPLIEAQLARDPRALALMRTTIAPTMLSASIKENVLPGQAQAAINFRLHPRDSTQSIMARARALLAPIEGIELAWAAPPREASPVSAIDSPAFRWLSGLAREAGEGVPVAPALVLGGTDGRAYSNVAQGVYRFVPVRLEDDEIASIHGDDERLPVKELARAVYFYARLMQELGS